ncbi:MAG: DUF4330 family protein [Ruminococcaceae bacterium]|nr:DUF4330 family protein [Oscillospiraceae bacterium]
MSEKAKKIRFNVIDLLVIILIIAAIAVIGVSKFMSSDAAGGQVKTMKITFFAEEVSDSIVESIEEGSIVSDSITEVKFGGCSEIKFGESISYISSKMDDGSYKYIATSRPGYKSITLSCTVTGKYSTIGAVLEDNIYGVGHTLDLLVGNSRFTARVRDIVVVEE